MFKDALIVMVLGMGTVFLVLLALLGLMTLGGKLAGRFVKRDASSKAKASGADLAAKQAGVAAAVAAAASHRRVQQNEDVGA